MAMLKEENQTGFTGLRGFGCRLFLKSARNLRNLRIKSARNLRNLRITIDLQPGGCYI